MYVWAQDGEIDPAVRVFLVLLYAVNAVPLVAAYWILSRVFANIHRGEIFSQRNAAGLLYYGLLQLFTALLVPFLKLGLCGLFNLFSQSRIALSTCLLYTSFARLFGRGRGRRQPLQLLHHKTAAGLGFQITLCGQHLIRRCLLYTSRCV